MGVNSHGYLRVCMTKLLADIQDVCPIAQELTCERLSLLSSSLRGGESEDELRRYISGLSNPYHASFEIGPGKRLPDGRFAFEVRLYEHYRGQQIQERRLRPRPSRLVLAQISPEDWLVDELP